MSKIIDETKDKRLFVHKFQPVALEDFGMDDDMSSFIKTLIQMNTEEDDND